jgi:hypothetical protein
MPIGWRPPRKPRKPRPRKSLWAKIEKAWAKAPLPPGRGGPRIRSAKTVASWLRMYDASDAEVASVLERSGSRDGLAHALAVLRAVLADRGFDPHEWLSEVRQAEPTATEPVAPTTLPAERAPTPKSRPFPDVSRDDLALPPPTPTPPSAPPPPVNVAELEEVLRKAEQAARSIIDRTRRDAALTLVADARSLHDLGHARMILSVVQRQAKPPSRSP